MPAKVNAYWWRMATEYGVIDDQREFLLDVDYSDPDEVAPERAWIRVRLSGEWNLAAIAAGLAARRTGGAGGSRSGPGVSCRS